MVFAVHPALWSSLLASEKIAHRWKKLHTGIITHNRASVGLFGKHIHARTLEDLTSYRRQGLSLADKQLMNFVVGKDTQVKGHVTAGTLVAVAYRPTDDGQNVALTITVRS